MHEEIRALPDQLLQKAASADLVSSEAFELPLRPGPISGPPIPLEFHSNGAMHRKTVVAGDMCFYPEGAVFRQRRDGPSEVLNVALTPAFVENVAMQTFGSPPSLRPFRGTSDPQIRHLAFALRAELRQGSGAHRIYQESIGVALCVHLLRYYRDAGSVPSGRKLEPGRMARQGLRRALDYVHAHLANYLTLAEIARNACMSPYHFSRAFKSSTGLSPHQFVLRARVGAAKELLIAGDLFLSEIASRVGFYDRSHLARHFKRRYGVPPSMFAKIWQ
jgi:AraC family transcriptional regulator